MHVHVHQSAELEAHSKQSIHARNLNRSRANMNGAIDCGHLHGHPELVDVSLHLLLLEEGLVLVLAPMSAAVELLVHLGD